MIGVLAQPGCVVPSITNGSVSVGSADVGAIVATPDVNWLAYPACIPARAVPSASIHSACSIPAVRPDCASPVFDSAFAFVIHCRTLPCPLFAVFTTTSKLYPKSTPVMLAAPITAVVIDCGAVVPVVSAASVVDPFPASTFDGTSPPTWSVTATAVPLLASVR